MLVPRYALLGGILGQLVVDGIQVKAGFLENSLRIGVEYRMLSSFDQFLVQLIDVRKVEISGHHQVFTGPITFSEIRMTSGGSIFP